MKALIFDRSKTDWERSKGFELSDVPEPVLGEGDEDKIIIKVAYAGVCGTDKGIWNRQAFKDAILGSIDGQIKAGGNSYRVIGHEFFGEVKQTGSEVKNIKSGDFVSCESHVICKQCFQCKNGQKEVCTNEKILGISHDGGFAEYAKVPAHIVWKTDTAKIRPEVAAMQEPFGNAVHAASKVNLKGKSVAIFGLGPIGLFLTLVARGLGAASIIGIEPNPVTRDMAKELGIDYVIPLKKEDDGKSQTSKSYEHNAEIVEEIKKITNGLGVDVAFEMAGFNNSVNNAIASSRRGGDVVLFGLKAGNFIFEDYNKFIMKGLTIHCVAGRQLWQTWETTKKLLEDPKTGVQEKLWNIILDQGKGTILAINDYSKDKFEQMMQKHPKFLIQF